MLTPIVNEFCKSTAEISNKKKQTTKQKIAQQMLTL